MLRYPHIYSMIKSSQAVLFRGECSCEYALSKRTKLCSSRHSPMNRLFVGFSKDIPLPKKGGYLLIDDEVPTLPDWKRPLYFDVHEHCFNPLKDIDYKKARELAEVLYTLAPQGENTLTVRNGKRALLKALLNAERLDKVEGDEEVMGMTGDILASPLLRKVLCNPTNFSFKPSSKILARINRAELGEFDSLVLGVLLMSHYRGQVVVPDLGFYGRDIHVSLVRQERLIGGVNFLSEFPEKLRKNCLLIKEKTLTRATPEDAETEAKLRGLVRGTVAFNDFVGAAVA